jgi:hypothetical protein
VPSHFCDQNRCFEKLPDGEACKASSQCRGGICAGYYVDLDGDGFGAGSVSNRCSNGQAPPGYATPGNDCCDEDKLVNPAQTRFFEKKSRCRTFDYDCDGTEKREFADYQCSGLNCVRGLVGFPSCGATDGVFRECPLARNCVADDQVVTVLCR